MNSVVKNIQLSINGETCFLVGDLTRHTIPQLHSHQVTKYLQQNKINIDFKQVEKVDTAGLAWVCALLEQANKQHCQLCFVNIPEQLAKLAKLSGVDSFLPIC